MSLVKTKLEQDGVIVREIRLNGSGASSVIMRTMMTRTVMMTMMIDDVLTIVTNYLFSLTTTFIH